MMRNAVMQAAINSTTCFMLLTILFVGKLNITSCASEFYFHHRSLQINIGGVSKNNHEGGDFKLENQIKRIKSLAPKGRISEDIWKKLICCDRPWKEASRFPLGLNLKSVSRKTSIVKYKACLRFNQYLTQISQDVRNTKGEKLNQSLIKFTKCQAKDKRKLYWETTEVHSLRKFKHN